MTYALDTNILSYFVQGDETVMTKLRVENAGLSLNGFVVAATDKQMDQTGGV